MKKVIRRAFVCPLLLATLMAACSSEPENANNNTAPSSPVAQNGTVPANSEPSPAAVQSPPLPQRALTPAEGAKVETDKAAPPNVSPGPVAQPAPSGPSPKLVVPARKIDFGKQPQSKSLARMITIRNGGKAPLKIDAVEPS